VPPENCPFFTWNMSNLSPGSPVHLFTDENFQPWTWTENEAAQQIGQMIGQVENAIIGAITINPNAPISNLITSVAFLGDVLENVPLPPGLVCAYLQIGTNADENIENAEVGFEVDQDWIAANNINENTLTLQHYVNGAWIDLPTTIIAEDENYVYLEATTPSFSVFAVTGESATTAPPPIVAAGISIIAIAAIVVGVFIVAFVIVWLRRSQREISRSVERLEASLGRYLRLRMSA